LGKIGSGGFYENGADRGNREDFIPSQFSKRKGKGGGEDGVISWGGPGPKMEGDNRRGKVGMKEKTGRK